MFYDLKRRDSFNNNLPSVEYEKQYSRRIALWQLYLAVLAPILTGFIAQTWSFVPALLTGAGIAFLGAMAYQFLVVRSIPEQDS